MHGTTILDLPTELLQKTFDYINWDRTQHLVPFRPDIVHISLTCRHLRKAVLPVLFRTVTLKLRWVNGALAEPGLLRLGQNCPQLIQYVRCVYVSTQFGHFRDLRSTMRPFSIPPELQRWLDSVSSAQDTVSLLPSSTSKTKAAEELLATSACNQFVRNVDVDVQTNFRDLVQSLTEQVIDAPGIVSTGRRSPRRATDIQILHGDEAIIDDTGSDEMSPWTADANARNRVLNRDARIRLDAFCVLLICFPSRLTSLVFEALPTDGMDTLQNKFALEFAAQIFKIYGTQLKQLTMKTPLKITGTVSRGSTDFNPQLEILGEAITRLEAIDHLRLASQFRSNNTRSMVGSLGHWHAIADRITHLDLRNVSCEAHEIVAFIEKFTDLQILTLGDFNLWVNPQLARIPRSSSHATFWLSFLIDLRRKLPNVEFDIRDLESSQAKLTESGIRWLLQEAVPTGADVGFDRETRLVEDFESFFPLWEAEDSQRGKDAEESRRDGKLVDQAMSSRWRGLPGSARK